MSGTVANARTSTRNFRRKSTNATRVNHPLERGSSARYVAPDHQWGTRSAAAGHRWRAGYAAARYVAPAADRRWRAGYAAARCGRGTDAAIAAPAAGWRFRHRVDSGE